MRYANKTNTYDVIVVGAGPAGMMAAGRAASLGASVLLLEKNKAVGKKLSITGGGRCNITNDTPDPKQFLEKFPQGKKFLYSPFSVFSVGDTIKFFNELDVPCVTQARNRMFPKSEKASDVTAAMLRWCLKNKVILHTNESVLDVSREKQNWIIKTNQAVYQAVKIVVSTGGYAAPETGSTGDGFPWLEKMGHTIHKPSPNVVPLKTNAQWVHNLSGMDWTFLKMRFYVNGIQKINKTGKLLFTHFGISGPMVLNTSYEVSALLTQPHNTVECSLDLYPDTEYNELDKRLIKLFDKTPKKKVNNILGDMLGKKMTVEILKLCKIDSNTSGGDINREERRHIVSKIKDLRFNITGTMGFDRAVIADGGIPLEEINFKTMESKKQSGIYIIGDLLNINRPSGGYGLQLCWTTGWVAGTNCV